MKKIFLLLFFTSLFASSVNAQSESIVKIVFAYTKKAAIEVGGGVKELQNQVQNGVNLTNEGLRNSSVGTTIQIVPQFIEVDYMLEHDNNTMGDLLNELQKKDGKFNKVHQYRQQLGGDILCLIYSGKGGGRAELNGDLMVASIGCFDSSYIFAHEFGHNLGATHEGGKRFTSNGKRTISANGGVAIPYYSANRTVNYKGVKYVLGDENKNNSATMRNNALAKSKIGENLPTVATSNKGLAAKIVDPSTAVVDGAKEPYKFIDFTMTPQGKNIYVTFDYECTLAFAQKARTESYVYQITPIMANGEPNNAMGSFRTGFNPGSQNETKTFKFNPKYPNYEMKEGSYVKLAYGTWNSDGSFTEKEVVKKLYIGGANSTGNNQSTGSNSTSTNTTVIKNPTTTNPTTTTTTTSNSGGLFNDGYYRITNQWQGEAYSIDLACSGEECKPFLSESVNSTGQKWRIKNVGNGIYTLSTKAKGEGLILECVNGENKNKPLLKKESGYSGGAWKIIPVGNGYYRINNLWLEGTSLDVINDGNNKKLQVAKSGNYSGQFWKITEL